MTPTNFIHLKSKMSSEMDEKIKSCDLKKKKKRKKKIKMLISLQKNALLPFSYHEYRRYYMNMDDTIGVLNFHYSSYLDKWSFLEV